MTAAVEATADLPDELARRGRGSDPRLLPPAAEQLRNDTGLPITPGGRQDLRSS